MVAAIMLQKKRLVDILEEACDLDPLSGVGGGGQHNSSFVTTSGIHAPALSSSSVAATSSSIVPLPNSNKRRRNSLLAAREAESKTRDNPLMLLAESSSFHSSSESSTTTSTSSSSNTPTVRFSSEPPQVRYFSNYLPSMNEEERERVRKSIWYTRDEFESFMMDRVHTIRVWRSVGGDISNTGLGVHYCLRGLEPYQSPAHNAEMHSHRYLYTTSVLNEQERLRAFCGSGGGGPEDQNGCYDRFAVAKQVLHMSHRASQQARLLALQDEKDARDEVDEERKVGHHGKRRSLGEKGSNGARRRKSSSMTRRHTMNHTTSTAGAGSSNHNADPSRFAIAPPTLLSSALSPPSTTRNKVDVNLLKEMNAKFLQELMASRQSSMSSNDVSKPGDATSGKDASAGGDHMTLSSLMWSSGHASRLLLPPAYVGPTASSASASASAATSTMSSMRRRHSLDFDNVERNESIMSQPFLAIRRDSLHCLMSSSSSTTTSASAAARHTPALPS